MKYQMNNLVQMSPKIPPKAPQQDHDMEKNSAATLKRNTKNVCTKFHERILNGSQKLEVICQNRPQNTSKQPPEDNMMPKQ